MGSCAFHIRSVGVRIFDVAYRDTRADPIGIMRRIYDHCGLECTPEFAERLNKHIVAVRQTGADRHTPRSAELINSICLTGPRYIGPDSAIY